MELDPRRLVVLAAVSRQGGVLAAARALHVTPSAVSQQLARLEREAGTSLVVRNGRRSQLTTAGQRLAVRGERVAAEVAGAGEDLGALLERVTGTVTVVAFHTAIRRLVGPAAVALRRHHPDIHVRVLDLQADDALARLGAGTVDVVVLEVDAAARRPARPGLADVALLDDPFVVAVPLTWTPPRTFDDLSAAAWVDGPPGSATHEVLHRLARESGWDPVVAHQALEFPAVLALVGSGLGCALLPGLAAAGAPAGEGPGEGVRSVALPGLGARRLVARHRSGRHEPVAAVRAVVSAMLDAARP